MQGDLKAMRDAIDAALHPLGLTCAAIERNASQMVLFGSRAAGVAGEHSDFDLLVVGEGRSIHTRQVDLIQVPPEAVQSVRWLGSELASHVATYGRWLFGPDDWRANAHISHEAVTQKREGIEFQLGELSRLWPSLLPAARARHVTRLRREVQRLELMRGGHAVPPSRHLDLAWQQRGVPREDLADLIVACAMIALPTVAATTATGRNRPTA
jgi:hypothetical protein